MKGKKFVTVLIMLVMTLEVFSKENLSWGMTSKKLKKKIAIEQKYKNDFCEILLLPKGSIYENEYDEYLLFSKYTGLIAKLHNTNRPYEEVINEAKEFHKSYGGVTYWLSDILNSRDLVLSDKYNFLSEFPAENSFETLVSLYGLYDFNTPFYSDPDNKGAIQTRYINYKGIAYQLNIWHSSDPNYIYDSDDIYRDFQKENLTKLETIVLSFSRFIRDERKKDWEKLLLDKRNHGPFGVCWGMNKGEIPFIGEIENNEIGGGFAIKEYERYHFYNKEYLSTHLIKPNKSNDKIYNYTGIFDENQNLIQLVCVNYATHVAGIKNLAEQEKDANMNYDEMKKTISNNYGEGEEIQNRAEKFIQWQDSVGQKIELLQNSYIMKDYFGREGLVKYIWLIYSSPDYDSSIEEIKNKIDEKKLKQQQEEQEKEKIQNSYF